MKVSSYESTDSTVTIVLEPEHPAEIALLNLLCGCEGTFSKAPLAPEADVSVMTDQVEIVSMVKKNTRGY